MRRILVLALLGACGGDAATTSSTQPQSAAPAGPDKAKKEAPADESVAMGGGQDRQPGPAPAMPAPRQGHVIGQAPPPPPPAAKGPAGVVYHDITAYFDASAKLWQTVGGVLEEADDGKRFDHARMRAALEDFRAVLDRIDGDLERAAADPSFALEYCPSCYPRDWNLNGRFDDGDRLLLQVEVDDQGNELPEGDPRRTPKFHFDVGDLHWARAMLAFQRAAVELVLAYRWEGLDAVLAFDHGKRPPRVTIKLDSADRVHHARDLILLGLDEAEKCRAAYLAETDDDREWVPSPKQKNHPIPLSLDQKMYERWGTILGDVRRLVRGQEGLSVGEASSLLDDDLGMAKGFIDFGRAFDKPTDFVLDFSLLEAHGSPEQLVAKVCKNLFGAAYVPSMKKSPVTARLLQARKELDADERELGRKLRYLLWLN
jgi:hypothetical protein